MSSAAPCKAKVADLQLAVAARGGEKQILRLEVAVYKVALAQVAQPVRELQQIAACLHFSLSSVRTNDLHEVTTRTKLKHYVDMSLSCLHFVQAHNIRVVE